MEQEFNREILLDAIKYIDENPEIVPSRDSTKYDVLHESNYYPPIFILSIASEQQGLGKLLLSDFGNSTERPFEILRSSGFQIIDKSYVPELRKFLAQAKTDNLTTSHFRNKHRRLDVKVSFGIGNQARVPWISFLKDEHTTSEGIYPVFLLYKQQNLLILAYGVSETNKTPINWDLDNPTSIKEYFESKGLGRPVRYGTSFVFKVYDLSEVDIDHKFDTDLDQIISEYGQVENVQNIDEVRETTIEQDNKSEMKLNTILYGPPGTGKTYALKNHFAKTFVIENKSLTRAEFLREKVEKLKWWETIAVALSIYGPKKVVELRDTDIVSIKHATSSNANLYLAVRNTLFENKVGTDYINREVFDLIDDKTWGLLTEEAFEESPELEEIISEIKNGHSSIAAQHNYVFTTFHQSYSYEDFLEGIKPVLDEDTDRDIGYIIEKGLFFKACDEACILAGYEKGLKECLEDDPDSQKEHFQNADPYAIFIDEINRGNIAAIFGELITLIEDDKRITGEEQLIVTLPYSKKPFGVPPNLYLIGTMNTADRSVEALDSALRRRFIFEEVGPKPSLLNDRNIQVDGSAVSLKSVIERINERIEILLDKDHLIGHSYFLKVQNWQDLRDAFQNKIIPLLEEYFYGDRGKIQLVLGSGFVEQSNGQDATDVFARNNYEESSMLSDRKVWIITQDWVNSEERLSVALQDLGV